MLQNWQFVVSEEQYYHNELELVPNSPLLTVINKSVSSYYEDFKAWKWAK